MQKSMTWTRKKSYKKYALSISLKDEMRENIVM